MSNFIKFDDINGNSVVVNLDYVIAMEQAVVYTDEDGNQHVGTQIITKAKTYNTEWTIAEIYKQLRG